MQLQNDEEILFELRPDSKILTIWAFTSSMGLVVVSMLFTLWAIGFFVFFATFPDGLLDIEPSTIRLSFAIVVVVGIVVFPFSLVYNVFIRKTYVYFITNQRCIFSGGILKRVELSVSYDRITSVEKTQTIFEKMMGIASIGILTSGTASDKPEIIFEGLRDLNTPLSTINEMKKNVK